MGLNITDQQSTTKGLRTAKVLVVLSFVLPYLVDWLNVEFEPQIAVYAPTWIMIHSEWGDYIGPTPLAALMFFYWLPYVFVGYFAYRYAEGRYSSADQYALRVFLVTLVAVLLSIPMMLEPRASSGGVDYYSTVIPLPLVSILSMVLIPVLRPAVVSSPWEAGTGEPSDEENTGE